MRSIWSNAFTVAIALAIALILGAQWTRDAYVTAGPLTETTVVEVQSGLPLQRIAERLEEAGAIRDADFFAMAARWEGVAAAIKAGEYEIPAGASMRDVLDLVSEGRVVQHRIRVAEGLTTQQVLEIVRDFEILTGDIGETPAEGVLAPDTYFVRRGDTRASVIERMKRSQERRVTELWENRDPKLPLNTPEEALILASIIEKETGADGERGLVASVFVNRLRIGQRLQTDPTVIYGITEGSGPLGRPLSRKDLRTPTPYNTYVIDGLPPGPIANPGVAALEAAINPPQSQYFYFVATCEGGTHGFSVTYDEHLEKVQELRACERQRRAQQGG